MVERADAIITEMVIPEPASKPVAHGAAEEEDVIAVILAGSAHALGRQVNIRITDEIHRTAQGIIELLGALPEIRRGKLVRLVDRQVEGPVFVVDRRTVIGKTDAVAMPPPGQVSKGDPGVPGVIPLPVEGADRAAGELQLVVTEFRPVLPAGVQEQVVLLGECVLQTRLQRLGIVPLDFRLVDTGFRYLQAAEVYIPVQIQVGQSI